MFVSKKFIIVLVAALAVATTVSASDTDATAKEHKIEGNNEAKKENKNLRRRIKKDKKKKKNGGGQGFVAPDGKPLTFDFSNMQDPTFNGNSPVVPTGNGGGLKPAGTGGFDVVSAPAQNAVTAEEANRSVCPECKENWCCTINLSVRKICIPKASGMAQRMCASDIVEGPSN